MRALLLLVPLLPLAARAEILAVPTPSSDLPAERTVVWSPLFQATWDHLNKENGPAVEVTPPNPLITSLDSFKWDAAKTFPQGAWKTWSGPSTADFLKGVNAEAAKMTGAPEGPFKITDEDPMTNVAFGLLKREVHFLRPLYRSKAQPMSFKTPTKETEVHFFGLKNQSCSSRILIWNPASKSHAVQLDCKEDDEVVLFYLPAEPQDFQTACRTLKEEREKKPDYINEMPFITTNDELRVPYLKLDSTTNFAPLLQGVRKFASAPSRQISRAEQVTRFELTEKGAKVTVETSAADPFGAPPTPPPPRDFIYDRPFFVFLWKKDAEWPYFGAWIGNTEAMELWKAPAPK